MFPLLQQWNFMSPQQADAPLQGTSFCEEYRKVPSVRSVLSCPVLMLTATAMVEEIICDLHLSNVEMVSVLPNRYTIDHLRWLPSTHVHRSQSPTRAAIVCPKDLTNEEEEDVIPSLTRILPHTLVAEEILDTQHDNTIEN
ncbi:hypothetical protein Bbelb_110210 [Branchiostoma belcheri]|nr:hypothetical protein Bbelb_110210 [Branchiostoma belcheri]